MNCNVCNVEPSVGVASLPFAAMSVAFCAHCLAEDAYPLFAIHATLDGIGGPENAAPWFTLVRSYHEGRYIGWDEILACYIPTPMDTV